MAQARINGQSVEVTRQEIAGKDVVYVLSGKDVKELRNTLKEIGAKPPELEGGKLMLTKSYLRNPDMNMPFLKILDTKLDTATAISQIVH